MRIYKKAYLRMKIHTTSSMSVGSGNNETTDSDIIRDGRGVPFIPGSAIAGVTSHALADSMQIDVKKYFGDIDRKDAAESCLSFFDALPDNTDGLVISVRDQVALDHYKTGIKGAKFDMEILEPGADFTVIIEQDIADGDKDILDPIACLWKSGRISFGAKTTRGYGKIDVSDIKKAVFDMTDSSSVEEWLTFDALSSEGWSEWNNQTCIDISGSDAVLSLVLGQAEGSGLSIRKYTTLPSEKDGESAPDYSQMTVHGKYPVIPGTSWAGAFRHHILDLAEITGADTDNIRKTYFGFVENKNKKKSDISFSESIIHDAVWKTLSRNAIDRFTGGAADKALYTEKTCYGGNTMLIIRWKKRGSDQDDIFASLLAASVADLSAGILSIGGETSIGRGMFKVKEINGIDVSKDEPDELYGKVKEILTGGEQ